MKDAVAREGRAGYPEQEGGKGREEGGRGER
jgi:hypothetical protein